MNDTISRQAAIDSLVRFFAFYKNEDGRIAFKMPKESAIKEAIAQVPSAQQWIPCSERKPPDEINPHTMDYKLYACSCNFGVSKDVRAYKYGDGHFWNGPGTVDEYVVAWMPMPEPYKEDDHD